MFTWGKKQQKSGTNVTGGSSTNVNAAGGGGGGGRDRDGVGAGTGAGAGGAGAGAGGAAYKRPRGVQQRPPPPQPQSSQSSLRQPTGKGSTATAAPAGTTTAPITTNTITTTAAAATAAANSNPPANDNDNTDELDLFGGLDVIEDASADDKSAADNSLSVLELNKLSETEQLTLAFQMSMQATQPDKNLGTTLATNNSSRKSVVDSPPEDESTTENPGATSAFGFIASDNPTTETNSVGGGSGFNFITDAAAEPGMVQTEERHINDDEPATDTHQEDMFAQLTTTNQLPTKHPVLEERTSIESSVSVSLPPESTQSPDMNSIKYDSSIMGQVKRAQKDYERAENSIWNALKATLDKESRTKQEINQLQRKLEEEQEKSKNAAQLKTQALQKNSFEEAEKQKNIINRCEATSKDIQAKSQKLQATLQSTRKEKLRYEKDLIRKAEEVQQKLQALHHKHEEAMQNYSREENERIDQEEQQVSNTLTDTQEQIEVNRREREKCDESLEKN